MVKQISITGNMKKNYVQPNTKVVLVKTEHHVLEGSSIIDEKSGNSDTAKDDFFNDDGDVFGW